LRLKTLIAVVGLLYVVSIGAGIVTWRLMPTAWPDSLTKEEQNKNEQIEKVFARFREPVREGQWRAVLTASGLVFLVNLFAAFSQLTVVSLEWITYPLATVAGLNLGLSVLFPKRQAATSRWLAFQQAWRDAGRLYLVIAMILAGQAGCEIFYVRQVLLHGGSGVPLAPY
jgi:hypothetical protein